MKKTLLLLLLAASSLSMSAQRRLVLIEEFTNDGCSPCASYSPTLDAVLDDRIGEVIAVKYHVGFPDNEDDVYTSQKANMNARINYYGINSVPTTVINGYKLESTPNVTSLNNMINVCASDPVTMNVTSAFTVNDGRLNVTVHVKPDAAIGGDSLRLFVAAIEEHATFASAFPNGETEQNYTCRQLLSGGEGINMGDVAAGGQYDYSTTWTISGVNDTKQLAVVAFVQNIKTGEILATGYAPRKPQEVNSLSLLHVDETPDNICIPDYSGKAIFRNSGQQPLTSAVLNVDINGTVKQYPWSGQLNYLEKDTLSFDNFTTFAFSDNNSVDMWFSNINDTDATSNHITKTLHNATQVTGGVQLRIYTDNAPEETSWKLYNSGGDVVQTGGPYSQSRHFYTENLQLKQDDCYQLEFLDAGGNGIKGAKGNGYFMLYQLNANGSKKRVVQGDYTGSVYDVNFHLSNADITLGIKNASTTTGKGEVTVYDLQGRRVNPESQGLRIVSKAGKAKKVIIK